MELAIGISKRLHNRFKLPTQPQVAPVPRKSSHKLARPLLAVFLWAHDLRADAIIPLGDFESHIQKISGLAVGITASCLDEAVRNINSVAIATNELQELIKGANLVVGEKLITLALKKGEPYPNFCHVMPKEFFKVTESHESRDPRKEMWAGFQISIPRKQPVYTYYWPKYFIEVSDKGNDPHPAFGQTNLLYSANRKVSASLSKWMDTTTPFTLAAKVTAGAIGIKEATKAALGQGFDLRPNPGEIEGLGKVAILAPFEQLRIRADKDPKMPSFEVNIWPVGVSFSAAEHLSLCGKGGYQWPIPGVPMTCPVAMSKDAWPYWDSGLLDYLNPNAIAGMGSSTNPAICITANLTSTAFDNYSAKGTSAPLGADSSNEKDKALADLPSNFRGLGSCSFPILGNFEAIFNQSSNLLLEGFNSGPWCTIWGPTVPRHSTHIQANAFGYANAALKFKLLAHDLFGVPRGKAERWSLVYPWEGTGTSLASKLKWLDDLLVQLAIPQEIRNKFKGGSGRSTMLMMPGDPRLIDEFNLADIPRDAQNLAKEAAYALGMAGAASVATKEAIKAIKKEHKIPDEDISAKKAFEEARRDISRTTDETAKIKGEPIYEDQYFCYVKGETHGPLLRGDTWIELEGWGKAKFKKVEHKNSCFHSRPGKCIKRHPLTGKCQRPESFDYVFVTRKVFRGYKPVQNPKIKRLEGPKIASRWETRTPNTHNHFYIGEDRIVIIGEEDTRDHLAIPDPNDPLSSLNRIQDSHPDSEDAVKTAAAASVWVGAELARANIEDLRGESYLPGKKRVYTIFEKVECEAVTRTGEPIYVENWWGFEKWSHCEGAIRFAVRKYFQTEILRPICDNKAFFNDPLGKPFQ